MTLVEYLPIRRDSGGPQKPFSSLSEGLGEIFTVSTESSEKTCDLHLHQLFTPINSSEGTDGGEAPRVGAVGRVGRSEEKGPPSALTSIIRVEKAEGEPEERY